MLQIDQINSYDSDEWKKKFPVIFPDVVKDYNHTIYTYQEMNLLKAVLHHTVYAFPSVVLEKYNILNALPYYYIQWILETNPKVVLDIGCGFNLFKNIIPDIIGIDNTKNPNWPLCKDVVSCHFNEEFAQMHQGMCDSLICINVIHFSPIWTIKTQLLALSRLLRPGGRAFVSFNTETWLMATPGNELQKYFGSYPTLDSIIEFMYKEVIDTNLNFLVSDWPICDITEHSPIRDDFNGNVRLVFELDNHAH